MLIFLVVLLLTAPIFSFGLVYKVENELAYTDLGAGRLEPGMEVSLYRPGAKTAYGKAVIATVEEEQATFRAFGVRIGDRVRLGEPEPGELLFVQLTDTHFGTFRGSENSAAIIRELKESKLAPEFAIISGDLTDRGQTADFLESKLLLELPFPIYPVPGNHDLRWAEGGKELYQKMWGPTYFAQNYGSYKLIGLDSSIRMEQYGHLEREQLKWLERELEGPEEKIVFLHHPINRTGYSQKIVDNEAEALALLEGKNVRVLLMGHLHSFQFWETGGIPAVVAPGALLGEYLVVNLAKERTTIYRKKLGEPLILERSFTKPQQKSLALLEPKSDVSYQGAVPVGVWLPPNSKGTLNIMVDGAKELAVAIETRGDTVFWEGTLPGNWTAGYHTLTVRLEEGGRFWQIRRDFYYQPSRESPKLLWEAEARGDLQAGVALGPSSLLVTTLNGWVQCFAQEDGMLLWERQLCSPLPGGAAWGGGGYYFGTEAGAVYSFSEDGTLRWSRLLGSVLAPPIYTPRFVLVGAGENLVALDPQTGEVRWQRKLGALIEAPPLVVGERVYTTSWEGSVSCLELSSGKLHWQRKLDQGIYAPGGASPALVQGTLLVATPRKIWGLDPKTGIVKWELEERLLYTPLATSVGGMQVAGTLERQLIGIDPKGAKVWEQTTQDLFTGARPVGGGEAAYLFALSSNLYEIRGKTAQPILRAGGGFVLGDPAFEGNRLYVTNLEGKVRVWSLEGEEE